MGRFEAMSLGWGGASAVSVATGLSRTTIREGVRELREREKQGSVGRGACPPPRWRGNPLVQTDPAIVQALEELVGPADSGRSDVAVTVDAKEHEPVGGGVDRPGSSRVGGTVAGC